MKARPQFSLSPAPAEPWTFWAGLGTIVLAFGAVRFGCLFNDLWLDEIWSLRLVEPLQSPLQILTGVLHDNNHPLNSLFLYLVQPAKADWHYRLFSWFMGTAAIWLAGVIARRQFQALHPAGAPGRARAAGFITALLFGGSYLFIHYSSEARGYAPAVGFSLLAICALQHAGDRRVNAWAAVYGLAGVLGLLAHFVAFQVLLAGVAWSAVHAWRNWTRWRDRLVHLAGWHLGPVMFLGLYYLAFIRKLGIGGGPERTLRGVLGELAAFTLGCPVKAGLFVALPLLLGAVVAALVLVWRRDRGLACFYATAVFFASGVGLGSSHFVLLFPRYFIVGAAGALLLAGYVLTRLWQVGGVGRAVCGVALAGFLLGNGVHVARLLRYGRGQCQLALQHIAARTPTAAITVSGDSDLRNILVVEYYAQAVGPGRELQYFPGEQLPARGSQWLLLPRVEGEPPPPAGLLEVERLRYQREEVYPHAALSGFDWYLYRNLDPAVLPPGPP